MFRGHLKRRINLPSDTKRALGSIARIYIKGQKARFLSSEKVRFPDYKKQSDAGHKKRMVRLRPLTFLMKEKR